MSVHHRMNAVSSEYLYLSWRHLFLVERVDWRENVTDVNNDITSTSAFCRVYI